MQVRRREHVRAVRELLRDNPESVVWPKPLRRAAGTRGFVREVQAVLARAREKGLDPSGLRALGIEHDLPELVAAGLFLEQYLTVLDNLGATDYSDLIRRAVIEGDVENGSLMAGQSVGMVTREQPAAEIVRELVWQAGAALAARRAVSQL